MFIASFRLNLGMPGHKAFFWMTPILIARLQWKCKIGAMAGSLFAALTAYSLGANLAGGVIGMPLVVIAGLILDWAVSFLEKNNVSGIKMVLAVGFFGAFANIICLAKRMILPTGITPHFLFSISGFGFKICSYAFFGLLSGIVASTSTILTKIKDKT